MRLIRPLLVLAISWAAILPASAAQFLPTGLIVTYIVPTTGFYSFAVAGAEGGSYMNFAGGGAVISGKLHFNQGAALSILAGEAGTGSYNGNSAGGGGGMSFISLGHPPLIVAGGGGAASWFPGTFGGDGLIGTSVGGTDGLGGIGQGAGAGWLTDGNNGVGPDAFVGGGGLTWPTFAGGAANVPGPNDFFDDYGGGGGFGGGGGGGYNCGGGGGGYSGGSGCGGGGGSFITAAASNVTAISGGNRGPIIYISGLPSGSGASGFVGLNFLSAVPEPSTWAIFLIGFGMVGVALRMQRRFASGVHK